MDERWRLEVSEWRTTPDGGRESFVCLTSMDSAIRVSGWVLHHERETPVLCDVMHNDAFLPLGVLARLLLKVDDVYWPRLEERGGVAACVVMDDFVRQHFVDGPDKILGLLFRPIKTFFSEATPVDRSP